MQLINLIPNDFIDCPRIVGEPFELKQYDEFITRVFKFALVVTTKESHLPVVVNEHNIELSWSMHVAHDENQPIFPKELSVPDPEQLKNMQLAIFICPLRV